MNKKWVFIVNPTAGSGFAGKYAEKVREKVDEHLLEAEMVFTIRKNHAAELAETYIEKGFQYIIAVGGDGTINEVARALVNKKDVTLGVVSAGTGNDFAQILGFPERFTDKEWDILFKKNVIGIDVGACNGNIFLNGMGLGFDAQVASENYNSNNEVKKGGKNKYLWYIIKTLLFYKEKTMTSFANGERKQTDCFIHTIANGRRFAGGFLLTPNAMANDGLLDICMIKKLSLISRFRLLLKVPKGTHIEDKKVQYYQTDQIRLEFDCEVPHHLDGELYFSSSFDVGILPEKLNIIYNPNGNHFFNVKDEN